jgi:hypothetical protein
MLKLSGTGEMLAILVKGGSEVQIHDIAKNEIKYKLIRGRKQKLI